MGITKIEGLEKAWMFIEKIRLDFNQITTIEGLSRCTKLVKLNLSYNHLTKIDNEILEFPCLKSLQLHGNFIADIEEVRKLS